MEGIECKIYNCNGEEFYTGELVKGLREGIGKEYHWGNGYLRYEGYFKNDKPHSKDIKIWNQKGDLEFEGEMTQGIIVEGLGELYHSIFYF